MAHPKRKHSKQRSRKRRTHYKTTMPETTETGSIGGEPVARNHCASPDGYYKGRKLPGYE